MKPRLCAIGETVIAMPTTTSAKATAFGSVFVDESEADAGNQDDADDDRLGAVAEEEGHDGGDRQ